jgi:spermidine dehydrogenase
MTTRDDRELGLTRRIPRRDFVGGMALGAAGAWLGPGSAALPGQEAGSAPALAPDPYPPALTGLRGQYPGSFEFAHRARDGAYVALPAASDMGETFDLVVVGAGISGLAAAYLFRQALGDDKSVLILDNHDDFGGHAKRNEFRHQGRLFIGYGGTQSIETPFPYSFTAKALIRELGIGSLPGFVDLTSTEVRLARACSPRRPGEDRLVAGYGSDRDAFLASRRLRGRAP